MHVRPGHLRWVALAAALGLSGCTCLGNELAMRRQPQQSEVSAVVRNDKAPWREAVIRREVGKVVASGRDPFNYWTVVDSLELRQGPEKAPERWTLQLASKNEQQTSAAEVRRNLELRWVLAYADDGHGLAVRVDRPDAPWTYVALDLGDYPLHCTHWTFGGGDDRPFDAAPTTRAVLLDALRGAAGKGEKHGEGPYETEVAIAADFACSHLDDRELADAVRAAGVEAPCAALK